MRLQQGLPCCGRWARIPLEDTEGEAIHEHFQAAVDFIQEAEAAGGAALVHCHEGRSRSVTLVLAYMLHTQVQQSLQVVIPATVHAEVQVCMCRVASDACVSHAQVRHLTSPHGVLCCSSSTSCSALESWPVDQKWLCLSSAVLDACASRRRERKLLQARGLKLP